MGQRRRGRECALQMLFQIDLAGGSPAEVFPEFWGAHEVEDDVRSFAERLVRGVIADRSRLDALLSGASERWRLERMAATDRNVLRIALWEFLHDPETPHAVVIDEAVEIARRFGNEESGAFVNGLLDGLRRRLAPEAEA